MGKYAKQMAITEFFESSEAVIEKFKKLLKALYPPPLSDYKFALEIREISQRTEKDFKALSFPKFLQVGESDKDKMDVEEAPDAEFQDE